MTFRYENRWEALDRLAKGIFELVQNFEGCDDFEAADLWADQQVPEFSKIDEEPLKSYPWQAEQVQKQWSQEYDQLFHDAFLIAAGRFIQGGSIAQRS